MSHFLKVDDLTLKGWGGVSEGILRDGDHSLASFRKAKDMKVESDWAWVCRKHWSAVSMPLGSNVVSFLKFPWTDLSSSSFPIDLKTHITFSSLSLPQCFPSSVKKFFHFFQVQHNCYWCLKPWFFGFPDTTLSDDVSPIMINFYDCVVVMHISTPLLL